jgi:general secretion pathway protein A
MYHDFYGLTTDPFRLSPDHSFCLRHNSFAKARAYMQFAADRAEGFVMITGRPGTGKTTLIEDVLSELSGQEVLPAKLVSAQLDAEDLLHMVAYNFGLNPQGRGKSAVFLELQGAFAAMLADGSRPLLIIDEAQALSRAALEELRLLTNLRIGPQPMLQIFLVGQEELRDMVLDPSMEQLHQRLVASCHLEPLDLKQAAAYVMHRLKIAGWSGRPRLRAEIFPALYRFSQGIPRRINLFMGRLMLHGWLEEKEVLESSDADEVLRELQHEHLAPLPNSDPRHEMNLDPAQLDEALLMPDQAIGGKLLQRESAPRAAQQAPPPHPAAPPPARPNPAAQRSAPERPQGEPAAPEPQPAAGESESPWQEDRRLENRNTGLRWAWLALILVLVLGLGAIALLVKVRQEGLADLHPDPAAGHLVARRGPAIKRTSGAPGAPV